MKVWCIIFFLVLNQFSSFGSGEDEEKFYLNSVGHGNSQLIIYNKIGLLYDAGSKSGKIHCKFTKDEEDKNTEPLLFLTPKTDSSQEIQNNTEQGFPSLEMNDVNSSFNMSNFSMASTYSKGDSSTTVSEKYESNINIQITKHMLSYLFVIASHPDEDHYNLINENNFPNELPITFIIGGDIFGHKNCIKEQESKKPPLKKFLEFISSRKNSKLVFTYYMLDNTFSPHLQRMTILA